jgi:hypothetical protein
MIGATPYLYQHNRSTKPYLYAMSAPILLLAQLLPFSLSTAFPVYSPSSTSASAFFTLGFLILTNDMPIPLLSTSSTSVNRPIIP